MNHNPEDRKSLPLRLAVIGAAGRIASDWLAVLDETDECVVDALVDTDSRGRSELAGRPGSTVLSDVDALLTTGTPDAAIVASPPTTHESIVCRLLEAGVHVLCEKPLSTSVASAQRMLDVAKRTGCVLMMASKFRFVQDVLTAAGLIADGVIGRPVLYSNMFSSIVDMSSRWNADPTLSGGGVLIDHGAHAVDLARTLVGDISRVAARFGPQVQELPVEDTVRVMFETFGDAPVVGQVDLSWSLRPHTTAYATVLGSEGELQLEWQGGRYENHKHSKRGEFGEGYSKRLAFRRQLDHFVDVVTGAATPVLTPLDAIESVRFVAAAYAAAENRCWVALPSPGDAS